MKKILFHILALFIIFSLSGCSEETLSETNMTPNGIASRIAESQSDLPEMKQIIYSDSDFEMWLSEYYQISAEQIEDGAIYYADGVEASEIAVLVMSDEKNAGNTQAALEEYRERRVQVFEGYAPEQESLAKNGVSVIRGRYAALLICENTSAANEAFLNCFGKSSAAVHENTETQTAAVSALSDFSENETAENGYNSSAVLTAWATGDDSALSDTDRKILKKATEIIEQEINSDMTDYEKELAIHDWITEHSSFDYGVFGRSSKDGFTDGSDTPYGVLIDGSAMCQGYSSAFKLFMDMLEIECITVFGTPNGNGVEHSWNMVKLDGEWYCVDCAWDDPIGGSPCHTYFNVTSEYLRNRGIHRWDEEKFPEATAVEYAYSEH